MMSDNNNSVSLYGGQYHISKNPSDAYRVSEGTVLVFIVPLKSWGEGRRSFIYEAGKGEIIPSFCHKDADAVNWRFCFTALEKAELEIIESGSTKLLKDRFASKIELPNYDIEGYNSGLVEKYKANILKEDILIRRTLHSKTATYSGIMSLIASAFKKNKIVADLDRTGDILYDSVAFLCKKLSIEPAGYERVREACGDTFGLADIARVSYISYRKITLSSGWEKRDNGAFLVYNSENVPLVCLQKGSNSHILVDLRDNSVVPVTASVAASLSPEAYMIYRPFPAKKLTTQDIVRFCVKTVRKSDFILLVVLTVIGAAIGLIIPTISQKLYDDFIPIGASDVLKGLILVMSSFMLANVMISIVKNLADFRIVSGMNYSVCSAMLERIFRMPESFFRDYESSDLAHRVMGFGGLVSTAASALLTSAVLLIFSTIYFARMVIYDRSLAAVGLLMTVLYSIAYYCINLVALKHQKKTVTHSTKASSLMYQFINGISKIRIAGVENQALYEYLHPYVKSIEEEDRSSKIISFGSALSMIMNTAYTIVFYIIVIKNKENITIGSFIAFTSMFASFSANIVNLSGNFVTLSTVRQKYKQQKQIFATEPEHTNAGELPGDISGNIEVNNVTFSYSKDEPPVLRNFSLNIRQGEYVGIVGPSGCGKSTLMKLLLGFEEPDSGKIYYDNKDIESIDKRELRKKMGVVLQNGKLISGSIYDNITITAPDAKREDVVNIIKAVGLESDIEDMPMGLYTMLSEDCNTISGGQQQRILIARALVSNPKILLFDEATSALDNITQSLISDTLDKTNATRVVIAHRLSTIIKCDRIIVMDKGRIVEQGTYDELMEMKGSFYQLASRQIS